MKTKVILLAAVQLSAMTMVHAADDAVAAKFELAAQTRQAVNLDGEHALSELTIHAGISWKPTVGWRVRVRTRAVVETELEPSVYRRLKADEAYLEYAGDACSVRAGVQQVVWGGADRLRVLDLVHPLDLRENLFGDMVQSRLPLGMLNTECSIGAQSVQWLLIPQFRHNLRPQSGSRFAVPLATDRIAAANLPVRRGEDPDWKNAGDWSIGLKWAGRLGPADVTLNAFHGWQGDPVSRLESGTPTPAYRANFERFSMAGASIAAPVGPFVMKGEFSVVPNAYAYYFTPIGTINSTRVREGRALVGLDYQASNWFLSSQIYVQHNSADQTLIAPKWQRIVTLAARREFLQGRLAITAYLAHDLSNPAQYFSISSKYAFNPRWQGSVSLDYFRGDPVSLGLFHPESRLLFGLRYDFI